MDHAANLGTSATLYIDHGAHGCTSAGQATEEAGYCIAYTLPYQLFVAVVLGLGNIVSHHRGKQGVDRAKTGKGKAGND